MENVAEALKMAAAVLIFVMALSISINAFGEARQSAQVILDNSDREYDYTYIQPIEKNGNIITERTVRGEAIVPAIYKAYKENYKIVFKDKNGDPMKLYEKKGQAVSSIDLENEVWGLDEKEKFIRLLLKTRTNFTTEDKNEQNNFKNNRGIVLQNEGLYDIIKGKSFIEKLGVYYQEEVQGKSDTPTANKTKKRVITYEEI